MELFSRLPKIEECAPREFARHILYYFTQDRIFAEKLCFDFIEDFLIKHIALGKMTAEANLETAQISTWINQRKNPTPDLSAKLIAERLREIPNWYLEFLDKGVPVLPRHAEVLKPSEYKDVVAIQNSSGRVSNLDTTYDFYDYNWGYSGVGPFQFAENILSHFTNRDQDFVQTWKIDFVIDFISKMNHVGGRIPQAIIFEWIKEKRSGKCLPYRKRLANQEGGALDVG